MGLGVSIFQRGLPELPGAADLTGARPEAGARGQKRGLAGLGFGV